MNNHLRQQLDFRNAQPLYKIVNCFIDFDLTSLSTSIYVRLILSICDGLYLYFIFRRILMSIVCGRKLNCIVDDLIIETYNYFWIKWTKRI